jgi:hypothetical protein
MGEAIVTINPQRALLEPTTDAGFIDGSLLHRSRILCQHGDRDRDPPLLLMASGKRSHVPTCRSNRQMNRCAMGQRDRFEALSVGGVRASCGLVLYLLISCCHPARARQWICGVPTFSTSCPRMLPFLCAPRLPRYQPWKPFPVHGGCHTPGDPDDRCLDAPRAEPRTPRGDETSKVMETSPVVVRFLP